MRAGEIGKYKCKIRSGCNKDCLIELQILKQPSQTKKKSVTLKIAYSPVYTIQTIMAGWVSFLIIFLFRNRKI